MPLVLSPFSHLFPNVCDFFDAKLTTCYTAAECPNPTAKVPPSTAGGPDDFRLAVLRRLDCRIPRPTQELLGCSVATRKFQVDATQHLFVLPQQSPSRESCTMCETKSHPVHLWNFGSYSSLFIFWMMQHRTPKRACDFVAVCGLLLMCRHLASKLDGIKAAEGVRWVSEVLVWHAPCCHVLGTLSS